MKRVLTLTICLLLSFQSFGIIKTLPDSIDVKGLSEKTDRVTAELTLLKAQNEALQRANDRIINSIYFTIGLIITAFIGLGIYNSFQGNKLNTQKMENLIQALKNEIYSNLPDRISNAVDEKEIKELSKLKSDISTLRPAIQIANSNLLRLKEKLLILEIPIHPFHKLFPDIDYILELLELQLTPDDPILRMGLDRTLEAVIRYLKSDEHLCAEHQNYLLGLAKDLKNEYPQQTSEIKALIKSRIK